MTVMIQYFYCDEMKNRALNRLLDWSSSSSRRHITINLSSDHFKDRRNGLRRIRAHQSRNGRMKTKMPCACVRARLNRKCAFAFRDLRQMYSNFIFFFSQSW